MTVFLCGETYDKCLNTAHISKDLMTNLGFIMNDDKSIFIPSQQVTYLGFIIDSVLMIVTLPLEKINKVVSLCKKLYNVAMVSIREVAKVIGVLVSCFPAVEYGRLYYRELEKAKINALKSHLGNFDEQMVVSAEMKLELKWWMENIHCQVRHIYRSSPQVIIQTDSSLEGWGVVFKEKKFGGRWKSEEKSLHINCLELTAILFGLQALALELENKHVKVLTDSSTAVSYVNNMGGIKSEKCNEISRQIWFFAIEKNIWVTCAHIPGKRNEADLPSRKVDDNGEWQLSEDVYKKICKIWNEPDIDLFASHLNHKVDRYCSWKPDPNASYIDTFTLNWSKFKMPYLFPPFSVLGRCIRKIQTDQAQAVIIVLLWPTQVWFASLMKILVDLPVILPRTTQLLTLPKQTLSHPFAKKLVLISCKMSGISTENGAFLKTLQTSSCHHGEVPQNGSTKFIYQNGYSSVVEGKLIPFQFLSKM